jgi:hypothetical protein
MPRPLIAGTPSRSIVESGERKFVPEQITVGFPTYRDLSSNGTFCCLVIVFVGGVEARHAMSADLICGLLKIHCVRGNAPRKPCLPTPKRQQSQARRIRCAREIDLAGFRQWPKLRFLFSHRARRPDLLTRFAPMFELSDQLTVARKIIVLDHGIAPAGVPLERGTIEQRDPPTAVAQNATVLELLGK